MARVKYSGRPAQDIRMEIMPRVKKRVFDGMDEEASGSCFNKTYRNISDLGITNKVFGYSIEGNHLDDQNALSECRCLIEKALRGNYTGKLIL